MGPLCLTALVRMLAFPGGNQGIIEVSEQRMARAGFCSKGFARVVWRIGWVGGSGEHSLTDELWWCSQRQQRLVQSTRCEAL